MASKAYLAVDMVASSGRGVVGRFDGRETTLEEVCRFENGAVEVAGNLHWYLLSRWPHVLAGLRAAGARRRGRASFLFPIPTRRQGRAKLHRVSITARGPSGSAQAVARRLQACQRVQSGILVCRRVLSFRQSPGQANSTKVGTGILTVATNGQRYTAQTRTKPIMAAEYHFPLGPWNIHEGTDLCGPSVLSLIEFPKRLKKLWRVTTMCASETVKKDNVGGILEQAMDAGGGILRLTPTWVLRSFIHPGKRLVFGMDTDEWVRSLARRTLEQIAFGQKGPLEHRRKPGIPPLRRPSRGSGVDFSIVLLLVLLSLAGATLLSVLQ